jgi:hypothetical protein
VHSYSLALPGLDFQEAAASLSSEVQVLFFEQCRKQHGNKNRTRTRW